MAVAEAPGRGYNPMLFLVEWDWEKLISCKQSVIFITENDRQSNVGYFSSEQFINEWITAIRHKTTEEFQKNTAIMTRFSSTIFNFLKEKIVAKKNFFTPLMLCTKEINKSF